MKSFFFRLRFLWFCLFKTRVLAAVDISGSIDPRWLAEIDTMVSWANVICDVRLNVFSIDSYYCGRYDRTISVQQYASRLPACGGTDTTSVIKSANGMLRPQDGLAIFTDGYLPAPVEQPRMSTLWVIAPGGSCLDGSYPGKTLLGS